MSEYMNQLVVRVLSPCATPGCNGETYFEEDPCVLCCPECKDLISQMKVNVIFPVIFDKISKKYKEHEMSFHKRISKSHVGNGAPQGAFAFTLTMSPNDGLTKEDMVKAVKKLMAQKTAPVKTYAWYLEYGDLEAKTHPHIHGMYETETGGRIPRRQFKRVWSIWGEGEPHKQIGNGFYGGYHRPVRDKEAYSDYIKKYDLEHDSNVNF